MEWAQAKYKTWFGSLVAFYQVALDWTLNCRLLQKVLNAEDGGDESEAGSGVQQGLKDLLLIAARCCSSFPNGSLQRLPKPSRRASR